MGVWEFTQSNAGSSELKGTVTIPETLGVVLLLIIMKRNNEMDINDKQ